MSLSRVSVYEVPSCTPPFRLVLTSVATGDIQINTPVAPQLGIKRSRDDFVFFTVRYSGTDAHVSYGVQLRDRKFAERLLSAVNHVTQKDAAAELPRSTGVRFASLPNGDASPALMAAALLEPLPPTLRRIEAGQVHVGAAIGKGCYGTVYEGKWQGRAVAVKQLDVSSRQAGGGEKSLKEFEVEARLMHRISEHPNVLSIIGILVALPQLSIVMEFMELTDLYAVLTSGDSISVSMEDLWIKGIANGLRHIARSGIIHRDIAARNVLLNRDYHPKIADFGLAIAHEENRAMEETAVNKWLSPEAISERVYTFKSDVWSYGVTVWEVVTKQIPYPGIDPMMACMRIVGDGLSPEIPADCAELHAQVMRACFIFDQHQRASIEQVCQILNI
jgi:tRNA A-37 threonylcarbamoyl transferase component Bud32